MTANRPLSAKNVRMTEGWGPPEPKPEPEKDSVTEPEKDSATEPEKDSPTEPLKGSASEDESGRLGKLPGRMPLTIAASIVAVAAIAATSWGLARHGGGEQAAPNDPDTGVTFGPNAPSETPSSSIPTFTGFPTTSTTLPTEATLPTATVPTFTGFPTSVPTVPYTPSYPTNTFSYPTPTLPLPTTTTTTADPEPTEVTPVAPVATPITSCGMYGSVGIVKTTGVRYSLVLGDGREGRWVVRATARKDYTIAAGAQTRFKGKLGQHYRCPAELAIRNVTAASTGEAAGDPWSVSVKVGVPKKEKRDLSVTYVFATDIELVDSAGDGWTCGAPGAGGSEVTCAYSGGPGKPSVSLTVRAVDGAGDPVAPSGTVSLTADDETVDSAAFDGNSP
jgi:hypothetical protein